MTQTIMLGVIASLLSAITAKIVVHTGTDGVHPLWLLLAQYTVGMIMTPLRRFPIAPKALHLFRLVTGLWAFGAYYAALASPGARPTEMSMVLNTAPVLAAFCAVPCFRTRLGALLAFAGVVAMLAISGDVGKVSLTTAHGLALSAAVAYAASFIVLGHLAKEGESPSTTNAFYNAAAWTFVVLALVILKPGQPLVLWPVLAVGAISAVRIQILTTAATHPQVSARVAVLANLAFIWLAIADEVSGKPHTLGQWCALILVIAGVALAHR